MAEYMERKALMEELRCVAATPKDKEWLKMVLECIVREAPAADVVPAADLANARSEAAALRRALEDVRAQLVVARAERDAAVADLSETIDCCDYCAYAEEHERTCGGECERCRLPRVCRSCIESGNFVWRGRREA